MDKDVFKGHFAQVIQAHQDHASDPQRDDIATGDQRIGGIEVIQLSRFLRPAQRRVRPQRGTEPRVEHVFFANKSGLGQLLLEIISFFIDANVNGGQREVHQLPFFFVGFAVEFDLNGRCADVESGYGFDLVDQSFAFV